MVEKREISSTKIYQDFTPDASDFWFGFKQQKFLHNIDTFYYSVKFQNDFTQNTSDANVLRFRKHIEILKEKMEYNDSIPFYVGPIGKNLILLNYGYGI